MNQRSRAICWATAALLLLSVAPSWGEWNREERRKLLPVEKMKISLEQPERVQKMQPQRVLDIMGVKQGQSVVDLGAGTGFFAFRMAERVGLEGKVYAVEIEDGFLEFMREKKERDKVANLVLVKSSATDPNLPPASCDSVLVSGSYYYFPDPVSFMEKIRAALKPGGLLAIADLDAAQMPEAQRSKLDQDIQSAAEVIEVVKRAGFVFREAHYFIPKKFLLVFTASGQSP